MRHEEVLAVQDAHGLHRKDEAMKETVIDIVVVIFAFIVAAGTIYTVNNYSVKQYLMQQVERLN